MMQTRKLLGVALGLVLLGLTAPATASEQPLAAAQGTDLWGGPGAKGAGSAGARFDTIVYVNGVASATGTVEFWVGGSKLATAPFSVPAFGTVAIPAPAALEGAGAFLYSVKSSAPVNAWSETYNENASGRFGVSIAAIATSDFLNPGDVAFGGGADASSSSGPGRARTNVGILCSPGSAQACRLGVDVYDAGALLGSGTLDAVAGSVTQASLATLVPAAAERPGLALQLRLLMGSGKPFLVKNFNTTSDGSDIPVSVARSAFSTAPTITVFDVTPSSGCPNQTFSLTWATVGATRVTISGVAGDLPPNGSTTVALLSTADLVLTAYSTTGESTNVPRRVTIVPPTQAPVVSPPSGIVRTGGTIDGVVSSPSGTPTVTFVQQESTGSTFVINGKNFLYTAGSQPGSDVVRLTASGTCGSASTDFSVTVTAPGAPQIVDFTAQPNPGCGTPLSPAQIILGWSTIDTDHVTIGGVDGSFPPNGATGVLVPSTTTFKLTAWGLAGGKTSKNLTVVVDTQVYTPIVTPSIVTVTTGTILTITISSSSVPDLSLVTYRYASRDSGGFITPMNFPGTYEYRAGETPGTDSIRFYYGTGCGYSFGTFTSTVVAGP